LSHLAPQLAQTFVSIASDIALVIDADGVIRHMAMGADPIAGSGANWVGRPWAETVSGDTRRKIELLLAEAQTTGLTRRREVNHPTIGGQDVPVAYTAIRLGPHGPVLAVGRDLRAVAAIQERFVVAQQDMERHYWQQRQSESRYRLLFQVATDAVMVVDAQTLMIVEANAAAGTLFSSTGPELVGKSVLDGVVRSARPGVEELLVTARASGRPAEIRARVANTAADAAATLNFTQTAAVDISATPFRTGDAMLLLVRARAANAATDSQAAGNLADFIERTTDAVTITDSSGRVLMANAAFASLCRLQSEAEAIGQGLAEVLGDPHHALLSILAEARRHGIAEKRVAVIGQANGQRCDVEISAAILAEGDQERIGLTLRRVDAPPTSAPLQFSALARAIDGLVTQIGQVPLAELVQEASDTAERHLIDEALKRTQGDGSLAAHLLGITPDYFELRSRYLGIGSSLPTAAVDPKLIH
jgi:transcriptional regulator PpsR